ncbi:MAG: hypothetical protein HC927_08560 [Deltaproteobacteria bacterium]|nr:hypothetical protein [Deltaproteobacteria bacterium]
MASQLPVLGYNIWWGLRGVRVTREELERLFTRTDFPSFLPEPPSDIEALRRALNAWRKTQQALLVEEHLRRTGKPGRKRDFTILVRSINKRGTKYAVFGLVGEQVDFERLGLRYATEARVLIEKLSPEERTQREPTFIGTTEAEGVIQAQDEARALTDAIRPLWRDAKRIYLPNDISGSILSIVESLPTSVAVRQSGGVYFVAASEAPALLRVKQLLESLPFESDEARPYFLMLPVVDEPRARVELAGAVQRGFLSELQAAGARLADLQSKAKKVSGETIAKHMLTARAIRDRARVYTDLLGMQQEQINQALERLTGQAQQILNGPGDEGEEEGETQETELERAEA